jgi:hypothetical protein
LAGWNGYELRAINKSQFAKASHSHSGYAATSHGIHVSGEASFYSYSTTGQNANNLLNNCIGYYTTNGPSTSIGAGSTDGSIYVQAYNSSWVTQIAQCYRNGSLFVRSKNNGTWNSWRKVMCVGDDAASVDGHSFSTVSSLPSSPNSSTVYFIV